MKDQFTYTLLTIGVTLFLTLHMGTAASYMDRREDTEDKYGANTDWDWEIINRDEDLIHRRSKRSIIAAIAAAAPIASAIFGAASFTYGVINGQQRLAELKEINKNIGILDQKINALAAYVSSLKTGQQWLEGAILYGDDEQRLTFLLDVLNTQLTLDNNGNLVPASKANDWADSVLELCDGGVNQVLFNFHNMMVGTSTLFGNTPIFVIFESRLTKDSSTYWVNVRKIVEYLYKIQIAGYAAWATALNIKGRTSDVPAVQQLGGERMAAQKDVLDLLTVEWPTGSYGLPKTSSGCPVAAGVTWRQGWRKHDTEDSRSSNSWSSGIHFPPWFAKNNMQQNFCMKTTSAHGHGNWPAGDYCIFKKYSCPSGFSSGSLRWDDEDDDNQNGHGGTVPDGSYGSNTVINYCCRNDGSAGNPITLPTRQPFYLFRFHGSCQRVKGVNVKDEYFHWDNEDDDNADSNSGNHPYEDGGHRDHRLHYCYYS